MSKNDPFAYVSAFYEGVINWGAHALPQVIASILLLVFGLWVSDRAAEQTERFIDRERRIDATLRGVISSVVRYTILIVILVAVLGQLGIQTTSILAALGAAGLAIGLALQGTLSNIAAGIMLLWLRPFRVGDYIDAGGVAGVVKEVGLFATDLQSWDGIYQFVPNAELWNKRIVNYSRLPTRLIDLKFGIAYEDDIEKGKATLLELAKKETRVLTDPSPEVFVSALGESSVELTLRVWGLNTDYWPTLRTLNEQGKIALEKAGLTIPFPQRDLHHYGLHSTQFSTQA